MKKILVLLTVALSTVAVNTAIAGNVNGVYVDGYVNKVRPKQNNAVAVVQPPPGTTVIDFDDMVEPCDFFSTTALTNKYAAQGVVFSGGGVPHGGAILDQCGIFSVTGHSSPNFLAFNCTASLSDNGTPSLPETLTFSTPASHVQINVGSASDVGTLMLMRAFSGTTLIGSDSLTLAAGLQTLSITANNITRVVLSSTACVAVMDDLAFTTSSSTLAIDMIINDAAFSTGDTLVINARITNDYTPDDVAKAIWIELPDGTKLSLDLSIVNVPANDDTTTTVLTYTFTGSEQAGVYTIGGRLSDSITIESLSSDVETLSFTP